MDKQNENSLIRTFRLLKQILRSLGRLFQEKTLSISNSFINANYFLGLMTVRFIDSPL